MFHLRFWLPKLPLQFCSTQGSSTPSFFWGIRQLAFSSDSIEEFDVYSKGIDLLFLFYACRQHILPFSVVMLTLWKVPLVALEMQSSLDEEAVTTEPYG